MRRYIVKSATPDDDHKITFGTLQPDGTLTNVRLIRQADIGKCPHFIMVPEHYREDGSCKCDDPGRATIMGWLLKAKDAGLLKAAGMIATSRHTTDRPKGATGRSRRMYRCDKCRKVIGPRLS
jgi:hypothetical protein